jgi:hypothetical protein
MKLFRSLIAFAGVITFASTAAAQTATQDVTYSVSAINQISVSGGAQTLAVTTAVAGSAPTAVSSSGLTWAVTTNETNRKVVAKLDLAMAAGVTLTSNLTAPSSGLSAGAKALTALDQDMVTSIDTQDASALSLVYTLSATSAAGVVASTTRTVTYTIMSGV